MMAGAVWSSDMMLISMAGDLISKASVLMKFCRSVNWELAEIERMGGPFLIGESHTAKQQDCQHQTQPRGSRSAPNGLECGVQLAPGMFPDTDRPLCRPMLHGPQNIPRS
jgi:hypothetical protein